MPNQIDESLAIDRMLEYGSLDPGVWGNELPKPTPAEFSQMFNGRPMPRVRWSSASGVSPAFQEHIAEDKQAAADQLHNPTLIMDYREGQNYPSETGFDIEGHFREERELAAMEGTVDMDRLVEMFPSIMKSQSREEFAARTRNALREALAHQSMMHVGVMEGIGRAIGAELFNPLGLATFAVPAFNIVQASRVGVTMAKAGNIGIQSGLAQLPLSAAKSIQLESMGGEEAAFEVAIATAGGVLLSGAASGIGHAVRKIRGRGTQAEFQSIDEFKEASEIKAEVQREADELMMKEVERPSGEDAFNDKLRGGNAAEGRMEQEAMDITEAMGDQLDIADDLRMGPEPDDLSKWDEGLPPSEDVQVHPTAPMTPEIVETGPGPSWKDQVDRLYRMAGGADIVENKLYKYVNRHSEQKLTFNEWKTAVKEGRLTNEQFGFRSAGIKRLLQRANNKWRPRDQELTEAHGLNSAHGRWFDRRRELAGQSQGKPDWNAIDKQAGEDLGLSESIVRALQGIQRGKQGQEFSRIAGDFERSGGRFFTSQDPMEGSERLYEITMGQYRSRYMENKRKDPWVFESPSGIISDEAPVQGIVDAMKRLTKLHNEFETEVKVEHKEVLRRAAEEPEPPKDLGPEDRIIPTQKEVMIDEEATESLESLLDRVFAPIIGRSSAKIADIEARRVARAAKAKQQGLGSRAVVPERTPEDIYRPGVDFDPSGRPIAADEASATDLSDLYQSREDIELRGDYVDDLAATRIKRDMELKAEGSERAQERQDAPDWDDKSPLTTKGQIMQARDDYINNVLGRDVDGIVHLVKGWSGFVTKGKTTRPQSLMEYFNSFILPRRGKVTKQWKDAVRFRIRQAMQNKGHELQELAELNSAVKKARAVDSKAWPKGVTQKDMKNIESRFRGLKVVYDRSPEGPEKGKLRVLIGNRMIGAAQDTRGGGYSVSKLSDELRNEATSAYADIEVILRNSDEMGTIKGKKGETKAEKTARMKENAKRAKDRRIAMYKLTGFDADTRKFHDNIGQPGFKAARSDRRRLASARREELQDTESIEDGMTGSVEGDPSQSVDYKQRRYTPEQALKIIDSMPDSTELFGADAVQIRFSADLDQGALHLTFNAPDGSTRSVPVPFEKGQLDQLIHTLNSASVEPGVKREVIERVFEHAEKMVCRRV